MSGRMRIFLLAIAPAMALILSCLGLETSRTNLMGWFLLVMGVAYMAGGIIYFWIRKGDIPIHHEEAGDRSFWLILPGFITVFFGPPIEYIFFPELLPRNDWMEWAGLGLVGLGVLLRLWTRSTIKGLYTGHVEIQEGHVLVQNGPYRYIRHPGYAGLFVMSLGVSVAYSSLVGLLAILVLVLPGIAYRIKVEENLLREHFGEAYIKYSEKTKKVLPYVW